MYLRLRKNKNEDWIKYQVNFLDFFVFNLIAGLVLGLSYTVIIAAIMWLGGII